MKKSYSTKKWSGFSLCLLILLGGCCFSSGCEPQAKYERTDNLYTALEPNSVLVAEIDVGSITITGADVTDCNGTAEICVKAPTEEEAREIAEKVKIKLVPSGKTLTLKIEKARLKKSRSVGVSYNITVPKQTNLQLESDVGEICILDISGEIKAETDVGKIGCKEISGDIDLSTDVGEVNVAYCETAPTLRSISIDTDVGHIDLTVPTDFSATIDAHTDIGSIDTELPMTVKGTISKRLRGTIGEGKVKVSLSTDVGSIKIRQQKQISNVNSQ